MTVEHMRPLLESGVCTALLGSRHPVARGQVPEEVLPAVRLGRMTAPQKPDGGVWGVVVGDVFRRLVGRTLAKQFAEQGQAETHPFQYVGAYDSISRTMFHGLMDMVDGEKLVPFVRPAPQRTFGKTRSGMFGTCCKEKVANKETP